MTRNTAGEPLTCLDLFCGCGGFSLGMIRAGFHVLAAIDFNPQAIAAARENLGDGGTLAKVSKKLNPIKHILNEDITKFTPKELEKIIGTNSVDVIVGGPPCQGFSNARQRDGANHGTRRLVEDERRQLYQEFFRFVDHFRPRIFVMENVLGIRSAAGGEYYTRVRSEASQLGYRVRPQIEDAYRLGVPQKRRRLLFVGVLEDLPIYFPPEVQPVEDRAVSGTNLGAALGDLPKLKAGDGVHNADYDHDLRKKALEKYSDADNYLHKVLEIDKAKDLNAHVARPHNETDIKCFKSLKEGENSATALRRNPDLKFPYNRDNFKDRYTRQHMNKPCSTIVAHLSKDGLMFIHPKEHRSLTPREAARIQSFPDWFIFPEARTHSFRMIGNAVPPLVAEAVGIEIREQLKALGANRNKKSISTQNIPTNDKAAAVILASIIDKDRRALRVLSVPDLLTAWNAVFYFYQGLHPDECDHGRDTNDQLPDHPLVYQVDERIFIPRFSASGWPVHLVPLLDEVRRRYANNEISKVDFYPVHALQAGVEYRERLPCTIK
ncbi:MAG: DNA cytosine methyltransferase [Candidatus Sumerlaeia bacterium]|nr:DNA cytosine methyltransferase [Candidatus Sumerlaeia bacterium]